MHGLRLLRTHEYLCRRRVSNCSTAGTKAALRMEQEFLMHMEAEHVEAEPLPARELTMSDHLLGFVSSGVTGQLYREAALDDSQGSSGMKRIYYPSGAVFEGDMSEGLWHGLGKLLFDTGDIYVGGFRNDRVHGKGKFVDTKGNWYEGFFFDGVPHGYGQVSLPRSPISPRSLRPAPRPC